MLSNVCVFCHDSSKACQKALIWSCKCANDTQVECMFVYVLTCADVFVDVRCLKDKAGGILCLVCAAKA